MPPTSPISPTRLKAKSDAKRRTFGHLDLFHPGRLSSEDAFNAALEAYVALAADERVIESLFEDSLNGPPKLLEIVFACMFLTLYQYNLFGLIPPYIGTDDTGFHIFLDFICERIPFDASSFKESILAKVLKRFSASFDTLRSVQPSGNLAVIPFHTQKHDSAEEVPDVPSSPTRSKSKRAASQKQAKRARRGTRSTGEGVFDNLPFIQLGVQAPASRADAERLVFDLLNEQRCIFDVSHILDFFVERSTGL
jgi:hypothetical protein